MSLPPGFLDELRNRLSLSQVVGRKVMWDQRKSNQAKGDMWAPCPFHQEKTASFHVDDRKGFYYCFGCHAKGDAISFVRESENVGFMEAVEILAGEAGMPMPAPDPKAREKADRREQLTEVTEAASAWFRLQLGTGAGAAPRDYLDARGLQAATRDRFEIGYAPAARQGAFQALKDKGFDPDLIIAAGIATRPDDGGAPYDAFRDRITFPIRDPRGRCIGFGGRAMDPNARAKYLNTRETELFDKGHALYNHGPAREAAGKGHPLIVAEGYMDVIALSQAGFEAAVAPLGTAITEAQLQLLWRIADEPTVALDGDRAGVQAAQRLVDLALPLLEAGKSLRFALMPQGKDPDDLIKQRGTQAMRDLLDAAEPMVTLLWRRETEGKVFDSPERRAALDKALRSAVSRIKDPSLRRHYGQVLNDMRFELFRAPRRPDWQPGRKGGFRVPAGPQAVTRATPLAAGGMTDSEMRVALILATLCLTPALIDDFEHALDRLTPANPDHARLTDFLLGTPERDAAALHAELARRNLGETLENLLSLGHVRIAPCIRHPGDTDKAARCLAEEFAKLAARRGLQDEMTEALEDLGEADESRLRWRLNNALRARQQAETPRSNDGDATAEDESSLSKHLSDLIASRAWEKKSR
ncbi:DNA primase [Rhodobacteraceae bacterium W635]|uniref:DNA primase n=1 Tax=Nioella halotolerans TaxID=2303578 RepID=UPI000E3C994D|nr:DNA primase [Rhodobacteraceae bacterium W635]